jgi:AraC-like DNA-binding protein
MERIFNPNELCGKGCSTCNLYQHQVDVGFRYREYPQNCVILRRSTSAHVIFILMQGSIVLNCNGYEEKMLHAGEMIFIAAHSFMDLQCLERTVALVCVFQEPRTSCGRLNIQQLSSYLRGVHYNLDTLPVNEEMATLINSIVGCLRSNLSCAYMHQLQTEELLLSLRYFYPIRQVATFFYPIASNSPEFRLFVMRNIDKVSNVRELIEMSGLSRSTFYDKFRIEFNDENPKLWMERQFRSRILFASSQPNVTVKELAQMLHFDSEDAFHRYCKRHFNQSPQELIASHTASLGDF